MIKSYIKGLKYSPVSQHFPDLPSALLSTISIPKSEADTPPSSTAQQCECSKAQIQMEVRKILLQDEHVWYIDTFCLKHQQKEKCEGSIGHVGYLRVNSDSLTALVSCKLRD